MPARVATLLMLSLVFPAREACARQSGSPTRANSLLVISNVTVIDGTGAPPVRRTVVIREGRIDALGPPAEIALPPGAMVLEADGLYLIPGLWDMHTHIWDRDMLVPVYLAHGITGVRDMGGVLERWTAWEHEAAEGGLPLPRAVVAGQIVDGWKPFSFFFAQVETADSARRVVRSLVERGADLIKVYDRLAPDAYRAILAEAARLGIPVAGHVPFGVRAGEAAAAGQRSIEHLSGVALEASRDEDALRAEILALLEGIGGKEIGNDSLRAVFRRVYALATEEPLVTYDSIRADSLFGAFRRHDTWHTPTLVVRRDLDSLQARMELDPHLARFPAWVQSMIRPADMAPGNGVPLAARQRIVRAMHRRGIGILAGSDAPNPGSAPGIGLHTELALLVQAGLTPLEALQAATRNAAAFLGTADSMGTVERGKVADLVLLEADPLEDIRNTRRVAAVVLRGHLLPKDALEALLEGLPQP